MNRVRTVIALALGWTVGVVAPASGSTFVVPPDDALVRQAPVIAQVSVMSASPSPAEGMPSTDYVVLVERLLKGRIGGTSVVVRVPGGLGPDGVGLEVHGAPSFREGDRALLFLTARRDGTYAILHLALGAFHQLVAPAGQDAGTVATRRLLGSVSSVAGEGIDSVRDWDRFVAWIEMRTGGLVSSTDYFLSREAVPPATVRVEPESLPIAWAGLATKRKVPWRWTDGSAASKKLLRRTLRGPSAGVRTLIRFSPDDRTGVADGMRAPNGANEVLPTDPDEVIAGSFSCGAGGVVAVSATWYDPAVTFRFREGKRGIATKALEADVVVNDGADCLFGGEAGTLLRDSVLAHEIGHTLGLEHSPDPASPMFPVVLDRFAVPRLDAHELHRLESLYPERFSR